MNVYAYFHAVATTDPIITTTQQFTAQNKPKLEHVCSMLVYVSSKRISILFWWECMHRCEIAHQIPIEMICCWTEWLSQFGYGMTDIHGMLRFPFALAIV